MKPEILIVIVLALITGICLTRYIHSHPDPFGPPSHSMTTSDGQHYEQIVRSGRLTFNNDTTAIASLTPGGFFRYTYNNQKMTAEASETGAITYTFYIDGDRTAFNPQFLAIALKTTIARKFDK